MEGSGLRRAEAKNGQGSERARAQKGWARNGRGLEGSGLGRVKAQKRPGLRTALEGLRFKKPRLRRARAGHSSRGAKTWRG